MFFCEITEIESFCKELISEIVKWMEKIYTHPHLLSMVVSALLGHLHHILTYENTWWRPAKKAFMTIPKFLILQGFLPKGLDKIQKDHYNQRRVVARVPRGL